MHTVSLPTWTTFCGFVNFTHLKKKPGGALEDLRLLNGDTIDGCNEYTYLGHLFSSDGKETKNIRHRINQAQKITGRLNGIWWSLHISRKRKINIYNAIVKSVMIYGVETWAISEPEKSMLNAAEMDVLGRSARKKIRETESSINEHITTQYIIWLGHVQRQR